MVTKSFWVDRVKIAIYQSIPSPYYFNVIGTFFWIIYLTSLCLPYFVSILGYLG